MAVSLNEAQAAAGWTAVRTEVVVAEWKQLCWVMGQRRSPKSDSESP
jgi:hypothetical protein